MLVLALFLPASSKNRDKTENIFKYQFLRSSLCIDKETNQRKRPETNASARSGNVNKYSIFNIQCSSKEKYESKKI